MIEELNELSISHLELVKAIGVVKKLVHGAISVIKKLGDGVALVTEAGPKMVLPIQSVAHFSFKSLTKSLSVCVGCKRAPRECFNFICN